LGYANFNTRNAEKIKQDFPNIDDLDSTLKLPAKDLFILLAQKGLENAPEQDREAMKKTVVRVIGSSSSENGTATVSLEITTPIQSGPRKQNARLILSRYKGKWRVVKNAE
jgi:hypothetical protein